VNALYGMMITEKGLECLNNNKDESNIYLYNFSWTEAEYSLCQLERRAIFGQSTSSSIIMSSIEIDPSRSPFIKEQIKIMFSAGTIEELLEKVKSMPTLTTTYKVKVINPWGLDKQNKIPFEERRRIERNFGMAIPGIPDLHNAECTFAIIRVEEKWYFGQYTGNRAIWLLHQQKPHQYSTALSTRVARAVVNIAAPNPIGLKIIDPCCGIGTVLVEALSMGMNMIGSDNNPLVMKGARENIAHFGLEGKVLLRDIRDVKEKYDSAIIDMPYNLCSVITEEEKLELIASARSFTSRLVIVTIEPMDSIIIQAGFEIIDRGVVKKGSFTREVIVCE